MDIKKILNVLSVVLNFTFIFPLMSELCLYALYDIRLRTEKFVGYYFEIWMYWPKIEYIQFDIVIFGIFTPLILSQVITMYSFSLLLRYVTKNKDK